MHVLLSCPPSWLRLWSQAIPSKILNVIAPFIVVNLDCPISLFQFALASKSFSGSLSYSILLAWPIHLSCSLSIRKSTGSMLRDFRISELRT